MSELTLEATLAEPRNSPTKRVSTEQALVATGAAAVARLSMAGEQPLDGEVLIGSFSLRLGRALRPERLRRLGRGFCRYFVCLKCATFDHVETNRSLHAEAAQ